MTTDLEESVSNKFGMSVYEYLIGFPMLYGDLATKTYYAHSAADTAFVSSVRGFIDGVNYISQHTLQMSAVVNIDRKSQLFFKIAIIGKDLPLAKRTELISTMLSSIIQSNIVATIIDEIMSTETTRLVGVDNIADVEL